MARQLNVLVLLTAGLTLFVSTAAADTYQLILRGTVTLADGSPPPKTASVERVCSDAQGSAPGPITNKKGEYLWRMEVDPMKTRSCFLRANLQGYTSSSIDISALNSYSNTALPPLVLTPASGDPTIVSVPDSAIPSKAGASWKAAMKAVDAANMPEAASRLQEAVAASPKFAGGWNALGLVYGMMSKPAEARDAYQHAIAADPKMLQPYVLLAREQIRAKDWEGASKTADALLKADTKHTYPEIYLHQAVARYGLKDLAGAQASVELAMRGDPGRKRSEYVLGRILEAKGDIDGARQHMTKYVEQDPQAADIQRVVLHLQNLGKPEAGVVDPELELP